MSVQDTQRKLNSFGYELSVDGVLGPRTYSALFAYMGAKSTSVEFGLAAYHSFPKYQIVTPLRLAHFLAQAAAETIAFRYLEEIWGPTAAQRGYEDNPRLGNTQPGDGLRFKGRGIFQLTGRANYQTFGKEIGVDLLSEPELAAEPDTAVALACAYWDDYRLNDYADADNILAVSNGINRGNPRSTAEPNGYDQRKLALYKVKQVLS